MRIEQNNVLQMYQNSQRSAQQGQGAVTNAKTNEKTDRIAFSDKASKSSAALKTVQNDAADIENAASPAMLSSLAKQISEGTYNVSTEKLANAMLNIIG